MNEYVLTIYKEDIAVWRDFFRINARFMNVLSHEIVGGDSKKSTVTAVFRPVPGRWNVLKNAFRMERDMGTFFTLEVSL